MKTKRNILIAFILNLAFSVFEFIGGIITGSVAIISDAVHDLGDAASIGVSYFMEKKSKQQPDEKYTYGYARYSVLGGFITTLVLLLSSVIMIYNAVNRIITPAEINYNGMIVFAVVGVFVNLCAAVFTREGGSVNQKAVNLHMLEDVLGWIVVLLGAVLMKFTNMRFIDPIMSIGVSVFIFVNAIKNLKEILALFLQKAPLDIVEIAEHIRRIDDVSDVYHIHIWSMDGYVNIATMHIVADKSFDTIKNKVRKELNEHGIGHITIEFETSKHQCSERYCNIEFSNRVHNHSHHAH